MADHPQSIDGHTVVFDHITGNEWWVEVTVDFDGGDPDQVWARDTDEAEWQELESKDWGTWGGSFHIAPGNLVEFLAVDDGAEVDSCWFTHPAGDEECALGGDFEASFDTPGGNEWWVEVYVGANKPLVGVDARADRGPWHELTLRDWGAWAKSFHVPDGSIVEFRAHSDNGETEFSEGFIWPSGERIDTLDAAFGPKASNEWWVETYAIAVEDIVAVEAQADGGSWHALELKDWGAWAASFHVPDGSDVRFRATNEQGTTDTSEGFLWPDAVPSANADGAWPQEGSYVVYDQLDTDPAPSERRVDTTMVHHDGRWLAKCTGTEEDPGGTEEIDEFEETSPPFAPHDVVVGERVDIEALTIRCNNLDAFDLDVDQPDTYDTHHEGDPVTIDTWYGEEVDQGCRCLNWEAHWSQENGLVALWDRSGRSTWRGALVDTDAPITG